MWLPGRNRGPRGRQQQRAWNQWSGSCFYDNQLEIQSAIMVKQAWRPREVIPVVDESATGRTEALRQGSR